MRCAWLSGGNIKLCSAVDSLVVLNNAELETFCLAANYADCPVYQARQSLGRKISLSDYLSVSSLKQNPDWSILGRF